MKLSTLNLAIAALISIFAGPRLRFCRLNEAACSKGGAEACFYAAADYAQGSDDMAIGPYEMSRQLGNEKICDYAKDLRHYVEELAAWNAKKEARRAEMAAMLNGGDYSGAVGTAVSVYKSTVYAEQAVQATSAAGRMYAIDDYDLKVLQHWCPTGQVASLVRSEMRPSRARTIPGRGTCR